MDQAEVPPAARFARMVRAHRRRLGMTQEALARETGLSARGIGKLESGRVASPRPATLRLLASAFGLAGTDLDRFFQAAAAELPELAELPERVELPEPWASSPLPTGLAWSGAWAACLDQLAVLLRSTGPTSPVVIVVAFGGTAGAGHPA